MSILTNLNYGCGCNHASSQQASNVDKITYLDVTPLFEQVGSYVYCDTTLASKVGLYKTEEHLTIPVYILREGNYIALYYDTITDGQVVRSYVLILEIDDKLISRSEVKKVVISGGSAVLLESHTVDVIKENGENILVITYND